MRVLGNCSILLKFRLILISINRLLSYNGGRSVNRVGWPGSFRSANYKQEAIMLTLKSESLNRCYSILKEFVEGAETSKGQKGMARLALEQLQRVTAGNSQDESAVIPNLPLAGSADCVYRPRADN